MLLRKCFEGDYLFTYLITYSLTHPPTHSLTHSLTPWSRIILEELTGSHIVKKFPAFYGTWSFNTAFTSACHMYLSWVISIQLMSPPSHFLKIHLNISSPLCKDLPRGLFPPRFPDQNPACTHVSSPPYVLLALSILFFLIWSLK